MREHQFMHQSVSNLAWALRSAPLMLSHPKSPYKVLDEGWFQRNYLLHQDWLYALDADPEPLLEFLKTPHKLPLGKRFEQLIEFWLRESPHYTLMSNNVQLLDQKRTVGEMDFLFKENASGTFYHLEVACKFYLGYKNSKAWDHWIGPNGNDNLALKMDKLNLQLAIASTEVGKTYFDQQRWALPEPALLMKGMFFHHYTTLHQAKAPVQSATNYTSGWWVKADELDHFFAGESLWTILPKSDWLSPFESHFNELTIYKHYEMKRLCLDLLAEYNLALCVVQLYPSKLGFKEGSRGFVVPSSWPKKR